MERVIFIFVFLFGSCVGGMPCSQPSANACSSYNTIDEPHRSTKYTVENMTRILCDTNVVAQWYRFQADGKDVDMPTSCVDTDHCGTSAPIWLQGTIPSIVGEAVTVKACVNRGTDDYFVMIFGGTKCCHDSWDICVKNCGPYNVYWLRRTPGCPLAYCAGTQDVCPPGSGKTCAPPYPLMNSQPTLQHKCNQEKSTFECILPPHDNTDTSARFEVTWLIDGQPLFNNRTNSFEKHVVGANDNPVELDVFLLKGNLNKDLQCQVQSYYQNNKGKASQTLKSNNIFVGIIVDPPAVNVSEAGGEVNVSLSTSFTFCSAIGSTPNCDFEVEIKSKQQNSTKDISTRECTYQFTYNSNTKKCEAKVPVKAKLDFVKDGIQLQEIGFRSIQYSRDAALVNRMPTTQSALWFAHQINPIHVTTIDKDAGFCKFWMDPHVDPISGKSYDIFNSTYLLMYKTNLKKPSCKSKIRNLEIHLRTLIGCTHGYACTCGMVAVEENDYVEINTCTETKGIHHVIKKSQISDGTTFRTDAGGKKYYINFPSGAHLEVKVGYEIDFFEYVQLHIPSNHAGCEEGACGTFDQKQPIDFNNYAFKQCEETFFHDPKKPRNVNNGLAPNTDFCFCNETTRTVSCPNPNPNKNVYAGPPIDVKQNSNSNMCDMHKWLHINGRSSSPRGTKRLTGLTIANATNLCQAAFRRASLFRYCGVALESYPALLSGCIFDLQASDNLKFLSGYTSTYMGVCQIELSADPNNLVIGPDGQRTLKAELTSNMCPNDCSEQGTCSNGICTCHNRYQGPDCSVKIGAIPHIHFIYGSYDVTNLCDARNGSCSSAFVVADNLFYTQTLQCKIESLKVANGHLVPHTNTAPVVVGGLFSSSNEVECPLPSSTVREVTHGVMVAGFNISVTTDGHTFSNAQTFTLYDSLCQECTETGTCHIKSDVCAIDGFCRRKGEQNSQQQVCEPSVDQLHWTTDARIKEIDHYTASETGCLCPDDPGSFTCACCQNGGCPCGYRSPHQCIKCGQWNMCG